MRKFWILVAFSMLELCASINDEGRALLEFKEKVEFDPYKALLDWDRAADDPCLWFGVECFSGKVVSLNLKDLYLEGILVPELGKLSYLKSIILKNNSFSGTIPKEIGDLSKLELLDLQHNNFSGPVPSELSSISSLKLLGNRFITNIYPEFNNLKSLSVLKNGEHQVCAEQECVTVTYRRSAARKLLQVGGEDQVWHHNDKNKLRNNMKRPLTVAASPLHAPAPSPFISPSPSTDFSTPAPTPSPTLESPSPAVRPDLNTVPSSTDKFSPGSSASIENNEEGKNLLKIYVPVAVGVSFLLALSAVYVCCCRVNRVVTVRPWATGLSGQLQKAFVTGVPSLKRSELETACEDFSNIIGSVSGCKLYKGTLSSGVEIAVVSTLVTSAKDWSKQSESHFKRKISVLSKVNHKNFMNLLGYCAEQEPFTRMMVFEYAPNGTLFEHLHVKEAEQLDWGARLRIAMGIAYCLDHMHQLDPPIYLENLNSSAVYLTDDYASKVGDIMFMNESREALSESESLSQPATVYKFGMLMLEILSGRVPFSVEESKTAFVEELMDPSLGDFGEEDAKALFQVTRACLDPDLNARPTISQVVSKLKEITLMSPDRATPKVSPLWWAEIEILSTETN